MVTICTDIKVRSLFKWYILIHTSLFWFSLEHAIKNFERGSEIFPPDLSFILMFLKSPIKVSQISLGNETHHDIHCYLFCNDSSSGIYKQDFGYSLVINTLVLTSELQVLIKWIWYISICSDLVWNMGSILCETL
jgi:hypothetical protein